MLCVAELVRFHFLNTKHVLNDEVLTARDDIVFSHDSSRNPAATCMIDSVVDSDRRCQVNIWRLREFVIIGDLVAKWLKSFHVNSTKRFST